MNLFPERAIAETLPEAPDKVVVTCKPGQSLDHIADDSVDAVVMDPPYADNVMYAELSDFFYVWLKRTAGYVYPEFFDRELTDKDREAVANPVRHKGRKGAKALAMADFGDLMASIFRECGRVLKPSGIMTLMFTHKAAAAWDVLARGLMDAGFAITASWPVSTEAPGSLHIRGKNAATRTVFLACRPRRRRTTASWEEVAARIGDAVRDRLPEFRRWSVHGVDLRLASYGPALQELSRSWPVDAATPTDALAIADAEVEAWVGEHPPQTEEPAPEAAASPLPARQLQLEV